MAVDCAPQMWNNPIDFNPIDFYPGIDLPPLPTGPFHGPPHGYAGEEMYGDLAMLSGLSSPSGGFNIKRCQGFVRCDMDIDAEVVGWVIGKNGSTIKDLKNKTGCNMWVDQRALKLTITGPDARTVEHAAKSVEAYVAAAPIKAGTVEAAVTRSLDCPPHLLDILGDRATIARIVKETRAQVVVNKKMARAIIRGGPHAVQMACSKVQAIIAAAAAEHSYKAALEMERRALRSGAASESGLSDGERGDGGESIGSIGSRASSAVGSPACSAPTSPRSGSGRTWSLFSGPSAFAAGAAVLSAQSSPHAMSAKGAASAAPTPESLFATFPASPSGDSTSSRGSAAGGAGAAAAAQGLAAAEDASALSTVAEERGSPAAAAQQQQRKPAAASSAAASELYKLLDELKLTKYSSAFAENEVDMDAMSLMSEADFSEIGVPKGPRLKIMNAVKARKAASS